MKTWRRKLGRAGSWDLQGRRGARCSAPTPQVRSGSLTATPTTPHSCQHTHRPASLGGHSQPGCLQPHAIKVGHGPQVEAATACRCSSSHPALQTMQTAGIALARQCGIAACQSRRAAAHGGAAAAPAPCRCSCRCPPTPTANATPGTGPPVVIAGGLAGTANVALGDGPCQPQGQIHGRIRWQLRQVVWAEAAAPTKSAHRSAPPQRSHRTVMLRLMRAGTASTHVFAGHAWVQRLGHGHHGVVERRGQQLRNGARGSVGMQKLRGRPPLPRPQPLQATPTVSSVSSACGSKYEPRIGQEGALLRGRGPVCACTLLHAAVNQWRSTNVRFKSSAACTSSGEMNEDLNGNGQRSAKTAVWAHTLQQSGGIQGT